MLFGGLVVALFGSPASPSAACADDDDCSLNGVCDTSSGVCACDAEWAGGDASCALLDLLPTTPGSGFHPPNASSWGGSLVRGDDGRVHMFAALMTEHCGLTSWKTNSQVVHAVADAPLAPFAIVGGAAAPPVVPRFAHNPTIHRNGDGRFLLFHIGCGATAEPCAGCAHCVNGTTPRRSRGGGGGGGGGNPGAACNGPHWTGLRTSMSLDGPWRDEGEVTLDTNKSNTWITNPCVALPANSSSSGSSSSFMLYRQSGTSWPDDPPGTPERLGWAAAADCASGINCTWADLSPTRPVLNGTLEDQYLWVDHRGHYHALTHKNALDPRAVAGHMWSRDGLSWRTSATAPYNNTIGLVGGGVYQCGKRARPMLLVENGRPRFLSTGAAYSKAAGSGDHTFTSMQEIASP